MLRSSSVRLVKHLALYAVAMCAHPLLGSLASFALLISVSVAVRTERRSANQTALQVETYYNLNGTALGDKIKTFSDDGYSVISLSAYGTPPEVNYAAIWAQSGGTPFEVIYDADEATYNTWLESWKAKGYVSTHIAVTGPADSAVYAGVMEDLNVTNWAQECGMTSPYAYDNTTNGIDMFVKSFSMYGSSSDRDTASWVMKTMGDSSPRFSTRQRPTQSTIRQSTNPRLRSASGVHLAFSFPMTMSSLHSSLILKSVDG